MDPLDLLFAVLRWIYFLIHLCHGFTFAGCAVDCISLGTRMLTATTSTLDLMDRYVAGPPHVCILRLTVCAVSDYCIVAGSHLRGLLPCNGPTPRVQLAYPS